jgi:hypothetical protein
MQAMEEQGGFLLADGTGVGKTRQELAVAQTWAERGHPVVLVSPAEVLKIRQGQVSGSFKDDAAAMGIPIRVYRPGEPVNPGNIVVSTYNKMGDVPVTPETVLIFDESHQLKNADSARAKLGTQMINETRAALFASATPADKPTHLMYLDRMGVFEGKAPADAMRDLGLRQFSKEQKTRAGYWVTQWFWGVDPQVGELEVARRMDQLFERMTERGLMVKREISMQGVGIEFRRVPLDPAAQQAMLDIEKGFGGAGATGLWRAVMLMHQRRQQEPYKIPLAVEATRRALAEGRQVVLFVSRVNYSEAGRDIYAKDPISGERIKIGRDVYAESEGTAKSLRGALNAAGIQDIAELHGAADQAGPQAVAAFQAGTARVMLATVESGGTGINLDDRRGDRPRTMIVVTAPFSAVENVQAAGRVWRRTSKTPPQLVYFFSDLPVDQWNAGIIAAKMRTLEATVSGEVARLKPEEEITGVQEERPPYEAVPPEEAAPAEEAETPPPPRYEPTPEGEQAVIPTVPRRAMPGRRLQAPRAQRPMEETPLFGQERARRVAELEAAQTGLFPAPEAPPAAEPADRGWWRRVDVSRLPRRERPVRPAPPGEDVVYLVACCAEKLGRRAPARELYRSDLFQKMRGYAENQIQATGGQWFILSAKHELVRPDEAVSPYDFSIRELREAERDAWAGRVVSKLQDHVRPTTRIVVLAGEDYVRPILRELNFKLHTGAETPLRGLGIGQQKQWLLENTPGGPEQARLLEPEAPYEPPAPVDEALIERAERHYGVTEDWREAGYILPDGTMLDFSGRHYATGYERRSGSDRATPRRRQPDYLSGQRNVDHREDISTVMPDYQTNNEGARMWEFAARTGAVRFAPNVGADTVTRPTRAQLRVMVRAAREFDDQTLNLDIGRWDGASEHLEPIRSESIGRPTVEQLEELYSETGFFEEPSGRYLPAAPPFFSALTRTLGDKMPARASAEQVRNLLKSPGIKAEEVRWSGIEEWLAEQEGPVTKEAVRAFLAENEVDIQEVVRGFADPEATRLQAELQAYTEDFLRAAEDAFTLEKATQWHAHIVWNRWIPRDLPAPLKPLAKRLLAANDALNEFRAAAKPVMYGGGAYNLPGGESYRELLLIFSGREGGKPFVGTHWGGMENVLAHVRFDERVDAEGKRALFLQEIQSDWHAKGRKYGYEAPLRERARLQADIIEMVEGPAGGLEVGYEPEAQVTSRGQRITTEQWFFFRDRRPFGGITQEPDRGFVVNSAVLQNAAYPTLEQAKAELYVRHLTSDIIRDETAHGRFIELSRNWLGALPPAAPFPKTWHELVAKRMLRWAAARDFDRLAWTTGKQQIARWDLRKVVDALRYKRQAGDVYELEGVKGGQVVSRHTVEDAALEEWVGKDIAARIRGGRPEWVLTDLDLKMGGEWAEALYDRMLPQFVGRHGKKWGAAVEQRPMRGVVGKGMSRGWQILDERTGEVLALHRGTETQAQDILRRTRRDYPGRRLTYRRETLGQVPVWSVDITPAMRQAVLTEGQPLFEPGAHYQERDDANAASRAAARAAIAALRDLEGRLLEAPPGPVPPEGGIPGAAVPPPRGRRPRRQPGAREARTLGLAISPELVQHGGIDFVGRRVESAADLALLAQVLRDPRYETYRVFYVRAGEIVAMEATTSRMPGASLVWRDNLHREQYLADMQARMVTLGADGYWLVHNHPSGFSKMSEPDLRLSKMYAERVAGFQGHVVIDSGEYTVLRPEHLEQITDAAADWRVAEKVTFELPAGDPLLSPSIYHPRLGTTIFNAEDVAQLAAAIRTPGYIPVIYRSQQLVRALQEIPVEQVLAPGFEEELLGRMREFGSMDVFLVINVGQDSVIRRHLDELEDVAHRLFAMDLARDVIINGQSLVGQRVSRLPGWQQGLPESQWPIERVEAPRAPYQAAPGTGLAEIEDMASRQRAPLPLRERARGWWDRLIETQVNKFEPLRPLTKALRQMQGPTPVGAPLGGAPLPGEAPIEVAELAKSRTNGQIYAHAIRFGRLYRLAFDQGLETALNDYLTLQQMDKRIRDLAARGLNAQGEGVSASGHRVIQGALTPTVVNPRGFDKAKIDAELGRLEQDLGPDDWASVEWLARGVWELNRRILDQSHAAGIVSDESYQAILSRGDDYVPFQVLDWIAHVGGEEGRPAPQRPYSVRYQDYLRTMEGTERDVQNVLDASLNKAIRAIALNNRNRAARAVTDLAPQLPGMIERIPGDQFRVPTEMGEMKEVVSAFVNGERQNYAVSPEIARALLFLDSRQIGLVESFLGKTAQPLRLGATGANVGFVITNLARDLKAAAVLSKWGVRDPVDILRFGVQWVRAVASIVGRDASYLQALESGALFTTIQRELTPTVFAQRAAGIRPLPAAWRARDVGALMRETLLLLPKEALQAAQGFNSIIEEATKVTTYRRGLARGATSAEAAYEAANYGGSPNFARSGSFGQELNLIWMFYNARLQGTARTVRRFTETPATAAKAAALRMGIFFGMGTLLAWLWNQQYDDDHGLEEVSPSDRARFQVILLPETYQHSDGTIRRKYIKIAKEETEQLIAPVVEGGLAWLKGAHPSSVQELILHFLGTLSPVTVDVRAPGVPGVAVGVGAGALAAANPALRLPVELGFNYQARLQGRIVPRGLAEGVLPEEQVRPTTSPSMQAAARALSRVYPVSPIQLEYAVTSGTGGVGRSVLDTLDQVLGKRMPETVGGYERLARKPLLSRFLGVSGDQLANEAEERLYQVLDEARRTAGSLEAVAGAARMERLEELTEEAPLIKASFAAELQDLATELAQIRRDQVFFTHQAELDPESRRALMAALAQGRQALLLAFRGLEEATAGFTRMPDLPAGTPAPEPVGAPAEQP